jgi:hypothetical protein
MENEGVSREKKKKEKRKKKREEGGDPYEGIRRGIREKKESVGMKEMVGIRYQSKTGLAFRNTDLYSCFLYF